MKKPRREEKEEKGAEDTREHPDPRDQEEEDKILGEITKDPLDPRGQALGEAEEVAQTRISDDELILIKVKKPQPFVISKCFTFTLPQGPKVRSAASIILRGPSDMYCDEMERSIHDALCVVKVSPSFEG